MEEPDPWLKSKFEDAPSTTAEPTTEAEAGPVEETSTEPPTTTATDVKDV